MLIDLPTVAPVATSPTASEVGEGNVLMTLANLRVGWYAVRDLYPRFLALEAAMENDPPATKIQFGMALGRLGMESRFVHGHAKAWHLTPELLARANDLMAKVAKAKGWA